MFELIAEKKLNTRKDRTQPLSQIVSPELRAIVSADQGNDYQTVEVESGNSTAQAETTESKSRLPRRVKSETIPIFGEKLGLTTGEPANLYRDIVSLYEYYDKNKGVLSDRFPALIRMALRLQCELIAGCSDSKGMSALVEADYKSAKGMLSKKQKAFLVTNGVTESNIVSLLQTGAHNYEASYNLQQTIAMSLIVAGLLKLHCSKKGD